MSRQWSANFAQYKRNLSPDGHGQRIVPVKASFEMMGMDY
jgi:hypothetical protein